ncbi:putative glycosidase CRH2 [Kickxella alabastrina]|nr:putative glycosidase CRH2 [Kickxella alabastrina]
MKNFTISALALAALLQTAMAAGQCGSQSCGKDSPCCVRGYCNSNAMYCSPFNCEAGNSYSESSCWDTAHCVQSSVNFASGNAFAQIADYNGDPSTAAFLSQFEPSNAKQNNGELELTLVKQADGKGFGATVMNTRAFQYGTVEAVMRSGSSGGGVVSSFIIRNDKVGDEIDFEFVGANKGSVESNFYWHDQLDYTKMVKSPALPDTTTNYHSYAIQWTPDKIVWLVNGNAFRTVNRADTWDSASNTFKYPDSESYVSFSIWDGGSGAKGTSDWAGGLIQWGNQPFTMAVKSINIDCYYKGNETTYTPPTSGNNGGDGESTDGESTDGESNTSKGDESSTADNTDDDSSSEVSNVDESSSEEEESSVKSSSSKTSSTKTSSIKSASHDEDESSDADDEESRISGDVEEQNDDDENSKSSIKAGASFVRSSTSDARTLVASFGGVTAALIAACLF